MPVHLALKTGNISLAELLLSHNTHQQSTAVDGAGDTLLHLSCRSGNLGEFDIRATGNISLAELLLSHNTHQQSTAVDGAGDTLLHLSCRSGNLDAVRVAIAAGCDDANMQNAIGRTPLHEVASLGDQNLLRVMFKLHANANIHDKVIIV
ncbi:unnamed protein product [Strongylus vulgaris]|uniref:Uncharacterized protein n=1 Tax=Strongylus vulgaris TaxID=40348 RepID=A0A3P7J7A0_STRVU|nr:unnamed protein product [Strongylus vulgaris]